MRFLDCLQDCLDRFQGLGFLLTSFKRWSLSHAFGILGVITFQIASRLLSLSAVLSIKGRRSLITSKRSIQSDAFMSWGICVSLTYWYCFSCASLPKISKKKSLFLVLKGVECVSVMILDYFSPLVPGHSFRCSFKILIDELSSCRHRCCQRRPRQATQNAPALLEFLRGVE